MSEQLPSWAKDGKRPGSNYDVFTAAAFLRTQIHMVPEECRDALKRLCDHTTRQFGGQLTQHGLISATADMLRDHGERELAKKVRATKRWMPDCPIVNMPGCPKVP